MFDCRWIGKTRGFEPLIDRSEGGRQGDFDEVVMPIVDRLCFAALRPFAAERPFWRLPELKEE
jgi:hypothetical protein